MKRLLVTLVLLALPCSAWSAVITSAQDGVWAAGTTWVGGTAPGDGDTAIIATGHDVTVGTNVTVGTDGATGTEAIQVQGTGTLTVDTGSILTVKGDLGQQRGTTVAISGGLVFSVPSGSVYYWYPISTGTGDATMRVAGASASSRATVSKTGAGAASILSWTSNLYGSIDFSNAVFTGLGSSVLDAISHYLFSATAVSEMDNVAWVGCGKIYIRTAGATQSVRWNGVDVRTTSGTSAVHVHGTTAPGAGVDRYIKRLTIFNATPSGGVLTQAKGWVFDELVLHNAAYTGAADDDGTTVQRSLFTADSSMGQLMSVPLERAYTIENNIFLTYFDNPHTITEQAGTGTSAANLFTGNIFDAGGYTGWSDYGEAVSGSGDLSLVKNLVINGPISLGSALRTDVVYTITGNTVHGAYGMNVGETLAASTQISIYRNNLHSSMGMGLRQRDKFVSQSGMSLDNNAYWDMTDASNIDYGGNNTYLGAATYNPWWASGNYGDTGKGAADVYADPQFVDDTRTVMGYGGWVSVQAVAREMCTINGIAYDGTATTSTAKTEDGIRTWVFAGFAPTNAALATAGYGGTYIGAVEPVVATTGAALLMGW